jgi:hypothetical protein
VPRVRLAAKHAQQRPGCVDSQMLQKNVRDHLGAEPHQGAGDGAGESRRNLQRLENGSDQARHETPRERKPRGRRRRHTGPDEERRLATPDHAAPVRLIDGGGAHESPRVPRLRARDHRGGDGGVRRSMPMSFTTPSTLIPTRATAA